MVGIIRRCVDCKGVQGVCKGILPPPSVPDCADRCPVLVESTLPAVDVHAACVTHVFYDSTMLKVMLHAAKLFIHRHAMSLSYSVIQFKQRIHWRKLLIDTPSDSV